MDSKFIPLTCPNCNGKLIATADPERFVCTSCGAEQIILRSNTSTMQRLQIEISSMERELSDLNSVSAFSGAPESTPKNRLLTVGQVLFGLMGGIFLCFALLMLVPTPHNTTASRDDTPPPPDGLLFMVCALPAAIFFGVAFVFRRASRNRKTQVVATNRAVPAPNAQLEMKRRDLQSSLVQKRAELDSYQRTSGT